ncbi:MAG TPA: hypothetical protein VJN88_01975 [Ktedonobacterales bacterium]|nr:hypothetical protein [Ktedonobacterales bacterium]
MPAVKTEIHEYTVTSAPSLDVRNNAGAVTFTPGAEHQVIVRVTKRARGGIFRAVSESDLDKVIVTIAQEGDRIIVDTERASRSFLKNVEIDLDITTPASSNVTLQLNAGNALLRDLRGRLNVRVNAGNFDARGVTCVGECRFEVNAGHLELAGAAERGASLDVQVNAGIARLRLPRETPLTLDAKTTAGALEVTGWQVEKTREIAQHTAYGPLGAEPAGTLRIRVNAGTASVTAE